MADTKIRHAIRNALSSSMWRHAFYLISFMLILLVIVDLSILIARYFPVNTCSRELRATTCSNTGTARKRRSAVKNEETSYPHSRVRAAEKQSIKDTLALRSRVWEILELRNIQTRSNRRSFFLSFFFIHFLSRRFHSVYGRASSNLVGEIRSVCRRKQDISAD